MNTINYAKAILILAFFALYSCNGNNLPKSSSDYAIEVEHKEVVVGAEQFEEYIELLKGKRVGVVANHASFVRESHLVDSLLSIGIDVIKVFSPEHGFRGNADAGEKVNSEIDPRTNLPIISLYGDNKKPSSEQLQDIEILLFDLQDVGVRFYTYISTLHYIIEASADNNIPLVVLDRPNPNAHYIDGPILKKENKSFVGLHPIPIVYGMTIGELAEMINGELWTNSKEKCDLKVVSCLNYNHNKEYILPIAPSPNLPNQRSIYLYPSLCLFEGTTISVGRGTNYPFQQIGSPEYNEIYEYSFTPVSSFGAKKPKHQDKNCYGIKFYGDRLEAPSSLDLSYLIYFYIKYPKDDFFNNFFNFLAGDNNLKEQIILGKKEAEIKSSWKSELEDFKILRKKYLIYKE